MERITGSLRILLPVALMLALGVLCRRKKLISRAGVDALKTVAVQIGLPAVLLHTFAVTRYTLMDLLIPLIMYLICIAAWLLGRAGGRLLRLPGRFTPFLTTGFEAGMLGYALFALLHGGDRVAEFARIDLGQVLFVFTLYKILLGRGGDSRPTAGQLMREMLASPIILAILAGVLLGATGLYQALIPSGAAGILDACTDFVSAPVSALILLSIGYDLKLSDISWRATLGAVGLRLAIMAALGAGMLLLCRLLWQGPGLDAAVILMFILPPPYVLPVFADDADQRAYLSSALSVSTLISILGFGVLALLGI